jgi:hypothetical protein
VPTAADDVFFDGVGGGAGAITLTVGATRVCRNFDASGFVGTLAGSGNITVSGSWNWGSTAFTQSWTGGVTFNATSGTLGITTHGVGFPAAVLFNGVGGTWQQQDALTVATSLTVTNGSFDSNTKALQAQSFSSSNTNVRGVKLDGSTVTLTCGVAAPWAFATATNLTFSATGARIVCRNNTATTYQFQTGGLTYGDIELGGNGSGSVTFQQASATTRDIFVTNTGAANFGCAVAFTTVRNFDFTGFNGTYSSTSGFPLTGSLTHAGPGMTWTNSGAWTFGASSGTQLITSNGGTVGCDFIIACTGATAKLADALTFGATKGIRLKLGTFDSNGMAVDGNGVNLSDTGFGVRTFTCGASVFTCRATGTPFACSSITNLTFNCGTSEFIINDPGATTKTVAINGLTLFKLTFSGAGTGTFVIAGNNTQTSVIDTLTVLNPPHAVKFIDRIAAIVLGYQISHIAAVGTPGNLITLASNSPGAQAFISKPSNDITGCDYLSIQDLVAAGGARWFAGRHSVNAGNNNGWRFTDQYRSPQLRTG